MRTVITAAALLSLVGCNEFSRSYDKIDGEFARSLSMLYTDPDMAPGDTVTLRTFWAGKPINPANVKWDVSWEYYADPFGKEAVYDYQPLAQWIVQPMTEIASKDSMQIFEMKFVIPDSIMYKSPGIPDRWADQLAKYGAKFNPADFGLPADKIGLLNMLDSLANLPEAEKAQNPVQLGSMIDGLCQFTAVKFRLYADYSADGGFKGSIDHPVRYHSKLKGIPGIYTNSRPVQSGARIYVVNGKKTTFKPESDAAEQVIAFNGDSAEVIFSASKTYFMEVDILSREKAITSEQAFTDQVPSNEEFDAYAYYDSSMWKTAGMNLLEDKPDQDAGKNRIIARLNFGEEGDIVKGVPLKFWVENSDLRSGAGMRPVGKDFREYTITFR